MGSGKGNVRKEKCIGKSALQSSTYKGIGGMQMGKTKGVISEQEWTAGKSATGDVEKSSAIVQVLQKAGTSALTMEAIKRETGLKWPYSTVLALYKAGTLERKKISKAHYYRLKRGRKSK